MTDITLLPSDEQTSILFESPMSAGEKARKLSVYAKSKSAALGKFDAQRVMADCLSTVYQELLFRGDHGKRGWSDYLASGEIELMGYQKLNTESAGDELLWHHLCVAIDEWNEANPDRPALPYPQGRSYMEGWATLFQRRRASGGNNYAPFAERPAQAALKAWYSACIKQPEGKAPNREISRSIGRQARDSGLGRSALFPTPTAFAGTLPRNFSANSAGAAAPAEPTPRTIDPAVQEQAKADANARADRQEAQRLEDLEDRKAGIDPRSLHVEAREELDALDQCQKYRALLNNAYSSAQALQVFLTSKINGYGSDYLTFLRQVDAGIWSVDNDEEVIEQTVDFLQAAGDLCRGHYQAGELDTDIQPEPTR
jgi:hypothetical protein